MKIHTKRNTINHSPFQPLQMTHSTFHSVPEQQLQSLTLTKTRHVTSPVEINQTQKCHRIHPSLTISSITIFSLLLLFLSTFHISLLLYRARNQSACFTLPTHSVSRLRRITAAAGANQQYHPHPHQHVNFTSVEVTHGTENGSEMTIEEAVVLRLASILPRTIIVVQMLGVTAISIILIARRRTAIRTLHNKDNGNEKTRINQVKLTAPGDGMRPLCHGRDRPGVETQHCRLCYRF